nr:hypothetical protein [Methylobacterium sp. Leaf122]
MSLTHAPNSIGRNKKGRRQAGLFFMHAVGFGDAGDGHVALKGPLIGGTGYSSVEATIAPPRLPGEPDLTGGTAG